MKSKYIFAVLMIAFSVTASGQDYKKWSFSGYVGGGGLEGAFSLFTGLETEYFFSNRLSGSINFDHLSTFTKPGETDGVSYHFTSDGFTIEGYTKTYSASNFASDFFINYYLLKNNHHLLSLGTGIGLTYRQERDIRLNGLELLRNSVTIYEYDIIGPNYAVFKVNYTYLLNDYIGIQANTNFSFLNEYFALGIGMKTIF